MRLKGEGDLVAGGTYGRDSGMGSSMDVNNLTAAEVFPDPSASSWSSS
jgi:hypothetical protein